MPGTSKSARTKSALTISAALAFVAAGALLMPTEAPAQFNIDGIIRGALSHQNHGYRSSRTSHRSSHSKDDDDSDSKSSDTKPSDSKPSDKGSDSKNAPGSGSAQSASSDNPPPPKGGGSGPPAGGSSGGPSKLSGGPAKTSDDEPSFTPAR